MRTRLTAGVVAWATLSIAAACSESDPPGRAVEAAPQDGSTPIDDDAGVLASDARPASDSSAADSAPDAPRALVPCANGPPGFTPFTDVSYSALGEDGWEAPLTNASIATDLLAPHSPTHVMRAVYPAGLAGGNAPFAISKNVQGASPTQIYACLFTRFSPNFVGHDSGINNLLLFWILDGANAPSVYLSALGVGSAPLKPHVRLNSGVDLASNVAAGLTFARDTWVKWEVYLKINSPGQSDGIVRVWLDGTKAIEHANVAMSTRASPPSPTWDIVQVTPFWGWGTGGTLGTSQYLLFDHLRATMK